MSLKISKKGTDVNLTDNDFVLDANKMPIQVLLTDKVTTQALEEIPNKLHKRVLIFRLGVNNILAPVYAVSQETVIVSDTYYSGIIIYTNIEI